VHARPPHATHQPVLIRAVAQSGGLALQLVTLRALAQPHESPRRGEVAGWGAGFGGEPVLNLGPRLGVHQRLVLAGQDFATGDHLT